MSRTDHHHSSSSTSSLPAPLVGSTTALDPGTRPDDGLRLDRRSVLRFATGVVAVGIPLLTIPIVAGWPMEPFLLLLVYGVYLGGAIGMARHSGPSGVRRLFSGVLRWQIGWRNWAIVAFALPAATILIALVTGTFATPADGWPVTLGNYAFMTFVFGALLLNIFEETAWQGLVQRNLTREHGPLRAAMITAIPFAAVHIPLSFFGDVTMAEAMAATALVFVFAPAMRYLMGRMDIATGGSLLAVGIMHASFNASGQLGVTNGEWQVIAGLAVVAGLAFATDRLRAAARVQPTGTTV